MAATTFPAMHELIPEGEIGTARVQHFEIKEPSTRMLLRPSEYIAPG